MPEAKVSKKTKEKSRRPTRSSDTEKSEEARAGGEAVKGVTPAGKTQELFRTKTD